MSMIGSVRFTQADIDWFAMASGDYNPVHVDPVAARRLITGGTVIHGMRTLLWMIEQHFSTEGAGFSRLDAYFARPVRPNEHLELLRQVSEDDAGMRLELLRDGEMVVALTLEGNEVAPLHSASAPGRLAESSPADLTFASLKGMSGQTPLGWASADVHSTFPLAVHRLGEVRIAAIMALSRLVGMQVPGLHSIFTGINISLDDDSASSAIEWKVSRASVPVAPIRLSIAGCGLRGHADAIFRPLPVRQAQMSDLEVFVTAGEFIGQRALVIGGSRGLGELVAKLVVVGGGEATISYSAGESDAQRVVAEIKARGGRCSAIQFDVTDKNALPVLLDRFDQPPTHVYYFPTPRIAKRATSGLDAEALQQFINVYVTCFDRVVMALSELEKVQIRVFFPSTSFVDDIPAGFAEYTAAKAAGELHCAYLNRILGNVAILWRRLPKLGTDQTASLIPQSVGSALEAMLAVVRSLHGFTKPTDEQ